MLNEFLRIAHNNDGTLKIPDTTYWSNALETTTMVPSIVFNRGNNGSRLDITTTSPFADGSIRFSFLLPSNRVIKKVLIGYRTANPVNFINGIRLTKTILPPSAPVALDIAGPLNSIDPVLYETPATSVPVDGAITLSLRCTFGNTTDAISVSSIGLVLSVV